MNSFFSHLIKLEELLYYVFDNISASLMEQIMQEETEFERQYADWMKQYTDWKEQNKSKIFDYFHSRMPINECST